MSVSAVAAVVVFLGISMVIVMDMTIIMAVIMVLRQGEVQKHLAMGHQILQEWKTAKNAKELAGIARDRKPNMMLLPYGIPMAIGSIAYFAFAGLLI